MTQDQIALQNVANRRAYADARFRGLQEYRNLETPREEPAWLVAQARSRQGTKSDRATPHEPQSLKGRLAAYLGVEA